MRNERGRGHGFSLADARGNFLHPCVLARGILVAARMEEVSARG